MMSIWTKLSRTLRAFGTARGGNVMITFAIATIPILTTVGFAVDYSRANSVKAAMQAALDSTALMLSKEAATTSRDDMQIKALAYFRALFTRPEATNFTITATYDPNVATTLLVSGSVDVPTKFLGILGSGYDKITVGSSSTSKWGSTRLRVALVLDTTKSMDDDGKIDALKTATHGLLTQLQNAVSVNGDVYVSIIPFAKDVRADMSAYGASWNDWVLWDDGTDKSWDGANGTCSKSGYSPRSSCVAQMDCSLSGYNSQSACLGAGTCSISGNTSQNSCTSAGVCSISGNTNQTSCNSAGTCSISGNTNQTSCTSAGVCSISGKTDQSSCTSAGVCSITITNPSQSRCGTCSNSSHHSQSSCTSPAHWTPATWTPGTWTRGTWTPATWTSGVWTATPGTWGAARWTHDDHSTWSGCITERGTGWTSGSGPGTNAGYDQDVTPADSAVPATMFPAEESNACAVAMKGLNYNWSSMHTMVDNLTPAGNTNQPIGLVWGWQSLVGGGPFASRPAFDANYQYKQVIILMSDGLNTADRWYSQSASSNPPRIDRRMWDPATGRGTCDNARRAGIEIYTIQVNTGGDATSTLLQNCASNTSGTTDHFFLLTQADQMLTTFRKIGTNLTQLRVAQ